MPRSGQASGPKRAEAGESGPGLTDHDCLALLCAGSLGGKNGFTLAGYAALSDRQIYALLAVEFDDEGRLVTEAERADRGSLRNAGRELPAPLDLGLSEEDFQRAHAVNPRTGTHYLLMFFQVWRRRGKTVEETMDLWREHAGCRQPTQQRA